MKQLSLIDRTALEYLADGTAATCRIAHACCFDRIDGDRATARARNLLRRLARWGMVDGLCTPGGGNIRWWKITDAGREAIRR